MAGANESALAFMVYDDVYGRGKVWLRPMPYSYRKEVLEELSRHGVSPGGETPPEIVRDFINDLYLYEIRLLKKRLKDGEIPMAEYADHVEALRNRYPILSLPLRYWTIE
ncbi:MAG TPA: hypothetical protein VNO14_04275 [Blastocatellia bacterium]|nr:hypothetical protein [Blastocatellia bacterium]